MFTRLAKSVLAGFWPVQPGRFARGPRAAGPRLHCNDNRPGFRAAAVAGKRRSPSPALACHWLLRGGRLQCCWHVVTDDARNGGRDPEHPLPRRVSGRARRLALAG